MAIGEINTETVIKSASLKHLELDRALFRLKDTRRRVDALLNSIHGHDDGNKDAEEPRTEPSLHEVLSGLPGAMHEECDCIDKLLEEIREAIF